jgi:hypothetical protein
MKEKLIIDFNGKAGKTAIPVYPITDISIDDYIKFEFDDAETAGFFDVRVTFNSVIKGQYIVVRTAAMHNSVYEFFIKQRVEENSEHAIKSEICYIECSPVNASFRITIFQAEKKVDD